MRAFHSITQWVCSECSFDLDSPEATGFATKSECRKHMLDNHSASFTPDDLPVLLNLSERTMMEPVSCPLCLNNQNRVHVDRDDHIAMHLHSFALRALPWDFDLDEAAASAGSSDSPPAPGHQPAVEDWDEDDIPLAFGALDDAVKDLIMSAESFAKLKSADSNLPVLKNLLPGSMLWEALPYVEASQKEKCLLLVTRVGENLKQLLEPKAHDGAQTQDLYINIGLDVEALEACMLQATRQDHDLWQEAFGTLSLETKRGVEKMINADEVNSRSIPEQLDNLLTLAWSIQAKSNHLFTAVEHQYADDIVESFQLIGDDESVFLCPQTNLPWAVVLAAMKVRNIDCSMVFYLLTIFVNVPA